MNKEQDDQCGILMSDQDVKVMLATNKKLNQELTKLMCQMSSLKQKAMRCQDAQARLKQQRQKYCSDVARLISKVMDQQQQISSQKKQIKNLENESQNVSRREIQMIEKNHQLELQLKKSLSEQEKLFQLMLKTQSLETQINEDLDQMNSLKEKIKDLEEKLSLQKECSKKIGQQNQDILQKITDFQEKNHILSLQLISLKRQKSEGQKRLREALRDLNQHIRNSIEQQNDSFKSQQNSSQNGRFGQFIKEDDEQALRSLILANEISEKINDLIKKNQLIESNYQHQKQLNEKLRKDYLYIQSLFRKFEILLNPQFEENTCDSNVTDDFSQKCIQRAQMMTEKIIKLQSQNKELRQKNTQILKVIQRQMKIISQTTEKEQ